MPFKFEKLEVWQLALEYVDLIYEIANQLPKSEEYNLKSQFIRAATSGGLNIAEGSTGQTDVEQARFLGLAIRSLIESVACQRLLDRRRYLHDTELLLKANRQAEILAAKLHKFRTTIAPSQSWLREEGTGYVTQPSQRTDDEG